MTALYLEYTDTTVQCLKALSRFATLTWVVSCAKPGGLGFLSLMAFAYGPEAVMGAAHKARFFSFQGFRTCVVESSWHTFAFMVTKLD
jgi:hypothetical protein